MSKKISSYQDLLEEEQRLMSQIRSHEVLIKEDVAGIGESLKPLGNVVSFLNKLATRDHTGPLTNFGIDFGIDVIVRKLILAKAGWFTKILVPFFIKNYSSHIISEEHRTNLAKKVQSIFNKLRPKKSDKTGYSPN